MFPQNQIGMGAVGPQNAANVNPEAKVNVDAQAFGAKFQSKREVYRFLTHDCQAYLSSFETMTIYHMADLAAGRRRRIKTIAVKVSGRSTQLNLTLM